MGLLGIDVDEVVNSFEIVIDGVREYGLLQINGHKTGDENAIDWIGGIGMGNVQNDGSVGFGDLFMIA